MIDINVLALAYLGDSVYEVYIRKYLIEQGIVNVNELQEQAIKYVSAKGQAEYLNHDRIREYPVHFTWKLKNWDKNKFDISVNDYNFLNKRN